MERRIWMRKKIEAKFKSYQQELVKNEKNDANLYRLKKFCIVFGALMALLTLFIRHWRHPQCLFSALVWTCWAMLIWEVNGKRIERTLDSDDSWCHYYRQMQTFFRQRPILWLTFNRLLSARKAFTRKRNMIHLHIIFNQTSESLDAIYVCSLKCEPVTCRLMSHLLKCDRDVWGGFALRNQAVKSLVNTEHAIDWIDLAICLIF